jgi:transcriptional regulator NrdR family protein
MTRSHDGKTFRRRKCRTCESLYTTVEQYVSGNMTAAVKGEQKNGSDTAA